MSSPVIKVENLSKQYRLGQVGTGSLSHDINRLWHRIRGNEDPYLKIGEENKRESKGNSDYVWALKDINFDIEQGDRVGIIGRNGAGKSTLLKILSRTTSPTTGSVKIKGKVASLLEVGTGFHPDLTGRDNIFLNGAILGMTKRDIKSRFDEIVDFSGVERYIDTPVKRYSSGMYVRLAFAVAAHLESDILIVDEVLAVGDAEFQKKCLGKMGEVSVKQGKTILFVSHNLQAISTLTKKCILMQNGNLKFQGNTSETLLAYLKEGKIKTINYSDNTPSRFPKINKVKLTTSHPNNIQLNGDQFIIEISITTQNPIKDLCLSVCLIDSNEKSCVNLWNYRLNGNITQTAGNHNFKCTIEKLKLFMGSYDLKVFLAEPPGGAVFEILENICPFTVNMYEQNREFPWHPDEAVYIEDFEWESIEN